MRGRSIPMAVVALVALALLPPPAFAGTGGRPTATATVTDRNHPDRSLTAQSIRT